MLKAAARLGDIGTITKKDIKIEVYDVVKPLPLIFVHKGRIQRGG